MGFKTRMKEWHELPIAISGKQAGVCEVFVAQGQVKCYAAISNHNSLSFQAISKANNGVLQGNHICLAFSNATVTTPPHFLSSE